MELKRREWRLTLSVVDGICSDEVRYCVLIGSVERRRSALTSRLTQPLVRALDLVEGDLL